MTDSRMLERLADILDVDLKRATRIGLVCIPILVLFVALLWHNRPWRGVSDGTVLARVEGQPLDIGGNFNDDGSPKNPYAQTWLSHKHWKYELMRKENSALFLRVFAPDDKVGEFPLTLSNRTHRKDGLELETYRYGSIILGPQISIEVAYLSDQTTHRGVGLDVSCYIKESGRLVESPLSWRGKGFNVEWVGP